VTFKLEDGLDIMKILCGYAPKMKLPSQFIQKGQLELLSLAPRTKKNKNDNERK